MPWVCVCVTVRVLLHNLGSWPSGKGVHPGAGGDPRRSLSAEGRGSLLSGASETGRIVTQGLWSEGFLTILVPKESLPSADGERSSRHSLNRVVVADGLGV